MFEVREGYQGTKRQGVSSEGVSAEKEEDLPLHLAFEARKGIAPPSSHHVVHMGVEAYV